VWCRKQGKSQKGYKGLKIDSDKKRGPSKFRILSIDEKSIFTSNLVNSSSPPPKNQLREYIMPSYLNTPQRPWLKAHSAEPYVDWSLVYTPVTLARFYDVDNNVDNNVYNGNVDTPMDYPFKCPFTTKGKGKGAFRFNLKTKVSSMQRNGMYIATSPTIDILARHQAMINERLRMNDIKRKQRAIKNEWMQRLRKR